MDDAFPCHQHLSVAGGGGTTVLAFDGRRWSGYRRGKEQVVGAELVEPLRKHLDGHVVGVGEEGLPRAKVRAGLQQCHLKRGKRQGQLTERGASGGEGARIGATRPPQPITSPTPDPRVPCWVVPAVAVFTDLIDLGPTPLMPWPPERRERRALLLLLLMLLWRRRFWLCDKVGDNVSVRGAPLGDGASWGQAR